jgi:hypothetical protein
MTDELVHAIEVMNRIERDMRHKWLEGADITKEMLERLDAARNRVKQLQKPITPNNG